MFDGTAEFRHEVATARMAALRKSAEQPPPRPQGRVPVSIPLFIVLTTVALAALALGGRAYAGGNASAAPQPFELAFAGGRVAIVGDPKDHSTRDLLSRIRNRRSAGS